MPQNITTHVAALVEAAEREIETLPSRRRLRCTDAAMSCSWTCATSASSTARGACPGAFHCPRGMLEFWIDPESKYHKPRIRRGQALRVLLRGRPALGACGADRAAHGTKPVAHIAGGFGAWKEAGGPVEQPAAEGSKTHEARSMTLRLIIGNKNYSSWSFRPWIAMKVAGIPFEEEVISLDAPDFKARVTRSPAPARCRHSSMAMCRSGNPSRSWNIWPRNFRRRGCGRPIAAARAHARAIAAEMHAGFVPLRRASADEHVAAGEAARARRRGARRTCGASTPCGQIVARRFGAGGPFLFGAFGAADAMYAPVVSRFHTYGVAVGAGRAPTWRRSWRCRPGANGGRRRCKEPGCCRRTRSTGRPCCGYEWRRSQLRQSAQKMSRRCIDSGA